jgi:hypothetical protein
MNFHPLKMDPESRSQRANEDRCMEALDRARYAQQQAKVAMDRIVELAVSAVNRELGYVSGSQQVARAAIIEPDMQATKEELHERLDDLLFQPIHLLSIEANEQ